MRDLFKTLELLRSESAMEYCHEFDGIKSIMEHCNKHVKPFNKLYFRGGNESVINELVRRLQEFFVECDLVDKETKIPLPNKTKTMRKILMFLMFNTDATYKYNLHDDQNVVHVLEICPLMPKFLLVTLVWELQLDQHFIDMLAYTPCWFSFQYFEPATDSLKYIEDPFEVLQKVEGLLKSIFISITRSALKRMDNVDTRIIYNKLYDYAMNLIRLFYTPDVEKFKNFTKNNLHKYSGFALKHLLELVVYTFDVYDNADVTKPSEDWKVYDVCSELCKYQQGDDLKESSDLKEQQMKIIKVLLNALQNNVMMVKIDNFIYWVEIDLNEKQNLQEVVGELAYNVGQRMLQNAAFGHDIQQQLKVIEIRPKTLEEKIHDATIGDILNTLDDDKLESHIKRAWFDELLSRTVALGSDECLLSIKQNINLMTVENCQQVLDFMKLEVLRNHWQNEDDSNVDTKPNIENMDVDPEDFEELSELIILAMQNLNVSQCLTVLEYKCKLFGFNSTLFSRCDISQRSTEFFNKFNSDESSFDVKHFLTMTLEQPQLLWQNFFENACHNLEHITTYTSTVKQCRPLSNNYYLPQLLAAFNDLSCLEQRHFPALLCDIYFCLYYPDRKTEFLKQIIHKHVNEFLDNQQFTYLLPLVKCLNLINSHGETQSNKPLNFGEITAPVLLMTAQIMDKARWDLITYTDVRDEIVRESIQFIQNTSKKFLPNATEKDRKWITKVIKDSYKPLTQYYFQKYSLTPDQVPVEFDRFLIRLDIEEKSEAEMFLIINYVRCTMKETEWLARSERLLPHISDVMVILSGVVNETENPNSISNYRHCLANYANIVQRFLLPQIEDDNKKIEKLEIKVLKIISSAPKQIYEETFMSFESLLLDIIKKCGRPLEENISKNIRKFVDTMKECSAKHIFLDKFQGLITELA